MMQRALLGPIFDCTICVALVLPGNIKPLATHFLKYCLTSPTWRSSNSFVEGIA
jgi:hypothetical protein